MAITDSLEADAARATGDVDRAAEASLRAGVDLLLTTGQGSAIRVHRRLLAVARRDARLRARVRGSGRADRAPPPSGRLRTRFDFDTMDT